MGGNNIGDKGAVALSQRAACTLEELNLEEPNQDHADYVFTCAAAKVNNVGPEGARALAAALGTTGCAMKRLNLQVLLTAWA